MKHMNKLLLIFLPLLSLSCSAQSQHNAQYSKLLKKYAKPQGVDYKAWSKNKEDKAALSSVLNDWSKINATKLAKKERAAFRINLYNAAMLNVALDNYPLKSVTNLGEKKFAIFDQKLISTPSGAISLNEAGEEAITERPTQMLASTLR